MIAEDNRYLKVFSSYYWYKTLYLIWLTLTFISVIIITIIYLLKDKVILSLVCLGLFFGISALYNMIMMILRGGEKLKLMFGENKNA